MLVLVMDPFFTSNITFLTKVNGSEGSGLRKVGGKLMFFIENDFLFFV